VEHAAGHAAAAKKVVDQILADPDTRRHGAYQAAQVLAFQGENDRAFEWLDRAADSHDAGLIYLKYDPLLARLRPDARYRTLLERLKLPVE